MSRDKQVMLVLIMLSFFLALAVMDYVLMHSTWLQPEQQYRYWETLGLVTIVFAFALAAMAYNNRRSLRECAAIFATTILLFIAGMLDIFYFMLATLRTESYSFAPWSIQYKLFGYWDWPRQIIWTITCIIVIVLIWKWAKK